MRSVKKWLAVLLTALLIVPGSPVSVGRGLVTEAAEGTAGTEARAAGTETAGPADGLADVRSAGEASPAEDDGESLEDADTGNGGAQTEDEAEGRENPEGIDAAEGLGQLLPDGGSGNGDGGSKEAEGDADASTDSLEEGDNVMDDESPDAVEGEAEPGDGIGEGGDAADSDLEEAQSETGLSVEEPEEDEQASEENLPEGHAEDIIASGADGDITWTLDSDGLLTVSGTGDFSSPLVNGNPWLKYSDSIVSAKVEITEITDASYMFNGCSNLKSLDLSGFDTSNVTDMSGMFSGCNSLTSLDLSSFDTGKVASMSNMFSGCISLTSLDLSSFDTSNVADMDSMFASCSSLASLNLSSFDTGNVAGMDSMFSGCSSLTSLDLSSFDTSNVAGMSGMFYDCSSLTSLDLSGFNTGNVTAMQVMFCRCSSLTSLDLSRFDTSNVTGTNGMFNGCSSLTSLDLSSFETGNVTGYMSGMFSGCSSLTSLDVSSFDTGNVTSMMCMFEGCESLESLDLTSFDTSNVTDMGQMFWECKNLQSIELGSFDTSNVTAMNYMFYACTSLASLDVSNFNTSNVTDMDSMFRSCLSLQSLDLGSFDTSNVITMAQMFHACNSLKDLDVSNFDTSNVTDMDSMFRSCFNLQSLDLRSFDTGNVTNMFAMFSECINLSYLDLSSFDTSKVTEMSSMFSSCGQLSGLDLSGFDMRNVTNAENMLTGCGMLSAVQAPLNLSQPVALPVAESMVWLLQDGTEITQLPQNLSESVLIERRDTGSAPEPADIWFQVTGAVGHSRYSDIYIAENSGQDILDTFFDPLYGNTYQTLFINDSDADLAALVPIFEASVNTEVHILGQGQQTSGESVQDFSKGSVIYSAIQYTSDDKTEYVQQNYRVIFAKRETGSKLFVNGPEEREIFLTDYFDNRHDILIANVGDAQLTGIKAELLDAVNVKLDDTWTVSSTLEAFGKVPGEGEAAGSVMSNFGKVRLVPDGEGEISGTLKITADGQDPIYVRLTGYSSNPKIVTTTTDLNMEDVIRVKYVPYSYTVETNNEYEWNKVTFTIEEGELARGLQMYPDTGEIYGVPLEAGEFPITVKATFSRPEFLPAYANLTLIVKDNTDGNVNVTTDAGYDLVQRVQDMVLDSMWNSGSQTMVSLGEYAEFLDVYLDGEKLVEGADYTSEPGSTRITIQNQTLAGKGVGSHTLGIEFRTQDTNDLRRAAQNYTVEQNGNPGSGVGGSGNGGGSAGTGGTATGSVGNAGTNVVEMLHDTADSAEAGVEMTIIYTVMPGDSLWKISARFYGTGALWKKIYDDNIVVISSPNRIYPGQKLVIRLAGSDSSGTDDAASAGANGMVYTVLPGENLWTIARKFYGDGRLWEKIYRANRELISDPRRIYGGQRIVIPKK